MPRSPLPTLTLLSVLAALAACSDPTPTPPPAVTTASECNPLGDSHCMIPWPSSMYAVDDESTATGRRLDIPPGTLPQHDDGSGTDPTRYNLRDGFSPAAPMIAAFPGGIDGSNLVHYTRYDDSLTDASPTVILDMTTGERVAHFAELDAIAAGVADRQALYIRPAARLRGNTRYAVAIRKSLRARDGSELPISAGFQRLLSGDESDHPLLERVRSRYPEIFAALEAAGIPRDDLVVAWDFTTASDESAQHDVLAARDAAIAEMGEAGENLTFEVITDEPHDHADIARRIHGSFDAPLFLENGGSYEDGTGLVRDPETGLPQLQGMYRAPFWAIVPECAHGAAAPVPIMIYGHGLLGSGSQATSGTLADTAAALCMVVVATDMRGMSTPDLSNVALALGHLDNAPLVFDVLIQGLVNHFALQHIVRGPMAQDLFVDDQGTSLVDPTQVVYYGLSQGHIFGSTFLAYDTFITRGVVGVGGANYSLMLERSSNWPLYRMVLERGYPDPLDAALCLHLIQMEWDRTDPAGTAHLTLGGVPGTPAKQVLMHMSVNDEQVPNIATEWQARTLGVALLDPAPASIYGLDERAEPLTDALVVFDGGFDAVPPTNEPPEHQGAHGLTRVQPAAMRQMARFYATGEIRHECGATACLCYQGACD